jgi:capsular polysaccharide transport system permease protein
MPSNAQNILWWNPLLHGTGLVRAGFYPTYRAEYTSLIYSYGLALVLIALGLIFMRSTYKTVLER